MSLRIPCTTLARDLRRRGIPFVVYSGHSRSHEASSEFGDAPWVVKPVPFEMLLKSLQAAMACQSARKVDPGSASNVDPGGGQDGSDHRG